MPSTIIISAKKKCNEIAIRSIVVAFSGFKSSNMSYDFLFILQLRTKTIGAMTAQLIQQLRYQIIWAELFLMPKCSRFCELFLICRIESMVTRLMPTVELNQNSYIPMHQEKSGLVVAMKLMPIDTIKTQTPILTARIIFYLFDISRNTVVEWRFRLKIFRKSMADSKNCAENFH